MLQHLHIIPIHLSSLGTNSENIQFSGRKQLIQTINKSFGMSLLLNFYKYTANYQVWTICFFAFRNSSTVHGQMAK